MMYSNTSYAFTIQVKGDSKRHTVSCENYETLKNNIVLYIPSLEGRKFKIYGNDGSSKSVIDGVPFNQFISPNTKRDLYIAFEDEGGIVTLIVHWTRTNGIKEIRRLRIPLRQIKPFGLLRQIFEDMFPALKENRNYSFFYEFKDALIPISTDLELDEFLGDMSKKEYLLHLKEDDKYSFEVTTGQEEEIRFLYLEKEVARSFISFIEKIKSLSPCLKEAKDIKIYWMDESSRRFLINSDEELCYFLGRCQKIYQVFATPVESK